MKYDKAVYREFLCDLFPPFASMLRRWEKIALDNGRWCIWGRRPPPKVPEEQTQLFLCAACSPPTALLSLGEQPFTKCANCGWGMSSHRNGRCIDRDSLWEPKQ